MTSGDEKLLLARLGDLERGAERGAKPCFSRFLDPKEIVLFQKHMHPCVPYMLWGGYDDSERNMLGFFPDFMEPDPALFPLQALRLSCAETPGHRTVLGSVMSLGIERSLIGDVAMEKQGAVLFACDSICDYLMMNLTRVGRSKVTLVATEPDCLQILPRAWEPISGTVASVRLDCVLGLLTGVSRSGAEELLKKELVSVNFSVCTKGSVLLCEGDVISVRGFGRAELMAILGETRKGRMRITLKKYT